MLPTRTMRRFRVALLLAPGLLHAGCSAATRPPAEATTCAAPHAEYVRHELYFGLGIPGSGGGVVTDEAWTAFAEEVLSRHFPAGMTVLDAAGEWRGDDGTHYREPTRVVVHLARADDEETVDAIEAVIAEAKRRFAQESVLWQHSAVCAAF